MKSEELYLFSQDYGVYGMLVVIAPTEEDARKIMKGWSYGYEENTEVKKDEIKAGLIIENTGDY